MGETLTILHPGIETRQQARAGLASRSPGLAGKRVALLDNGKVNAGVILNALAERLRKLGIAETRAWKKQHASQGADKWFPEIFAWKPDLALTALGD
jgi:hypothetical protein